MSKYAPHHRSSNQARATSSTICQKCLKTGHFTYDCKNPRPYVSRPSRSQLLEKPKALDKLKEAGRPSVEVPEEFKKKTGTADKILTEREKERKEKESTREKRARSTSESDSDSSSGSDSDSSSSSESDSSESSRGRTRKRRRSRTRSPS